jgi:hypothetical protein
MSNNEIIKIERKHAREACSIALEFTILFTQSSEFKRVSAKGKTIDKSPAGIGLITDFPLEPGHVLEWDDQHNKGNLHIAMVKWARQIDSYYRAGLVFI